MFLVIVIERVIIGNPIFEFNINWWVACFHQFQINKQSPCSTIPIYKRMNAFEFNVKPCKLGNNMFGVVSIVF